MSRARRPLLLLVALALVAALVPSGAQPAAAVTVEGPCSPRTALFTSFFTVTNRTSSTIDVSLVDSRCELQSKASIRAGRSATLLTRVGYRFIVRDPAGNRLADKTVKSVVTSLTVNPVTNRPPTVALTAPVNGVNVLRNSTVNLAASASDPDGTIAKVEFLLNGSVFATDTTAPYTATRVVSALGTNRFNARATDNRGASTTSADTIVVAVSTPPANTPPTVALTAPTNGTTVTAGSTVNLAATAADPGGSVARVEFLLGGTVFATDTTAPYTATTTLPTAGSVSFTARATDNQGATATSQAVTVTVTAAPPPGNTPPTVALTAPANGTTVTAGSTVNLAATAADPGGSVARVEFLLGGTVFATDTTAPYTATATLTAAGPAAFTARATDNVGAATTSSTVTVTVTAAPPPPVGSARILVLYDTTGAFAGAGETTAAVAATLAGHFGAVTTKPVASYAAGDIGRFDQTIYIGTTFDEPLPAAFLTDTLAATKPVLWANYNIWQLAAAAPDFAARYGFVPTFFGSESVSAVRYRGIDLPRFSGDSGLMGYTISDPATAVVIGQGVTAGGTLPWGIRSGRLTYVGENPFSYVEEGNRYLAFADLLFDTLAPATPTRTRALVRLEDVDPTSNPDNLRAFADYLASRNVPFSVAVIPEYRDPVLSPGSAPIRIADRPDFVAALRYMQTKGGTLLMHGYTHQYGTTANPINGRSGVDYEFTAMTLDAGGNPVVVGPVAEDSVAWATGRLDAGIAAFTQAGLAAPTIFEFPHYVASLNAYRAASQKFSTRYERVTYFPGALGGTPNYGSPQGIALPYVGTDVWGSKIIPENLGYVIDGIRPASTIVATAARVKAVRDAVASFFYHPYLPLAGLQQAVEGLQAQGWTFVAPTAL